MYGNKATTLEETSIQLYPMNIVSLVILIIMETGVPNSANLEMTTSATTVAPRREKSSAYRDGKATTALNVSIY